MATNWKEWTEESGFHCVYQGGHHNVYCDGRLHLRTLGGEVGHPIAVQKKWPLFKCDCARYTDAIQKREATPLHVREAPEDRQAVDEKVRGEGPQGEEEIDA